MEKSYAQRVAKWVETHDDGTPSPRTDVICEHGDYLVEIRCTELLPDGSTNIATERAHSLDDARAHLGY